MLMKNVSIKNDNDIRKFFHNIGLSELVKLADSCVDKDNIGINTSLNSPSGVKDASPYLPVLADLYVLYNLVTNNKRTTILEFGVGWSSLIFAKALNENKKKFFNEARGLRRNNCFEVHSVDNEKEYLDITKGRIPEEISDNSDVNMTTFNGRIATEYQTLPLVSPDLIYIDGPDQFNVKGSINGISTAHNDMMPMSCDLLKIEHFLIPGTIIVMDGRGANARFLKANLQRNWKYEYTEHDHHIFYLKEEPLGKINKKQLDFYKGGP